MSQQFNALTISSNIGGSGIKIRMPVMTVATTNLTISTSFVGQTVNGYTLLEGDRIALTAQTIGTQNGIYIASTTNRRAPDYEIGDQSYCSFYVISGLYAGTQWQSTTNGIIDVGTHGFVLSDINIYNAGDIMYSSSTTQRQLLNKPNVTSILQMTNVGIPSWINTVSTALGGTGLTSTTPLKVLATDSVGNYQLTNDLRINNILNTINTMCSFADGGTQYLTIGSGTAPYLQPTGTSTNIDLDIYTKGTGTINLRQPMRIYNGTQYVGIRSPTLSSNIQLTLPTTVGTANQLLSTDGTGQLSFRTLTSTDFGNSMYYDTIINATTGITLSANSYYYSNGTYTYNMPTTTTVGTHIMISAIGTITLNIGTIVINIKATATTSITITNATIEFTAYTTSGQWIITRILHHRNATSSISADTIKIGTLGELNNIPNVSVATANSGDVLVYNGTQWINQPYPTFVSTIFGRSGTVVAQEGDYSLNQLGDVTINTPSNGQLLQYNGTQWTNSTQYFGGYKNLISVNNSSVNIQSNTVYYAQSSQLTVQNNIATNGDRNLIICTSGTIQITFNNVTVFLYGQSYASTSLNCSVGSTIEFLYLSASSINILYAIGDFNGTLPLMGFLISNPSTSQMLQYDGQRWINTPWKFAINNDTSTIGQSLVYNGAQWINQDGTRWYNNGGLITSQKIFTGSATTNGSGIFTLSLSAAGFTTVTNAQCTALLGGSNNSNAPIASLQTLNTTTCSGIVVRSATILLGGQGLATYGSGIVVYIVVYGT